MDLCKIHRRYRFSFQPLVNLEPVSSGADAEELNVRITSLRAEIAHLEAEARGAKAPVFPEDLVRTGQRSVLAYLTDPFLGSFQTALRER